MVAERTRRRSTSQSRSMGCANRRLKTSQLPSSPGKITRKRLQSSPRWFSTGVPESPTRKSASTSRTARARRVAAFLMACASSRTRVAKRFRLKRSRSRVSRP